MKDLDELKAEQPGQGFQFPGVFEITAMGRADADLERRVPEIVESTGVTVLAGSQDDVPSAGGNMAGSAYLFQRAGGTWSFEQRLLPAGGEALSEMGWSVGLSAGIAAVGAQTEASLQRLVAILRERRVTWARIGAALQITRQSAWERFSGEE